MQWYDVHTSCVIPTVPTSGTLIPPVISHDPNLRIPARPPLCRHIPSEVTSIYDHVFHARRELVASRPITVRTAEWIAESCALLKTWCRIRTAPAKVYRQCPLQFELRDDVQQSSFARAYKQKPRQILGPQVEKDRHLYSRAGGGTKPAHEQRHPVSIQRFSNQLLPYHTTARRSHTCAIHTTTTIRPHTHMYTRREPVTVAVSG